MKIPHDKQKESDEYWQGVRDANANGMEKAQYLIDEVKGLYNSHIVTKGDNIRVSKEYNQAIKDFLEILNRDL